MVTASYSGSADYDPSDSDTVSMQIISYTGQVLITELRGSGPGGANDSYVELYNAGPPVPLDGFRIQSDSGKITTMPRDPGMLGTGRSFLITGSQYSLSAIAASDHPTGTLLGTGGFQVLAPDEAGTQTDAVGPASGYHPGDGLPVMSGAPGDQHAWVGGAYATTATRRPVSAPSNAVHGVL